jgi:glycosyltransferase involved in cell wall biosynthesis
VPWFRDLAARPDVDLTVFFGLLPDAVQQGVGFGVAFQWDIPMLDGYTWELLPNRRASPRLGRFAGSSTPAIHQRLRELRPDVVVVTGWNALPLIQALVACVRLRIPAIVRGESNGLRRRPAHVRILHRLLLRRFRAFLAIGKANASFYRSYGVPPSLIFEAPYFVDNGRFAEAVRSLQGSRAAIRERWAIPPNATCFAFIGKLEAKKRPHDVVRAVAKVASGSDVHLLVVGAGALEDELRALAAQLGVPCSFTGFVNQARMPEAYVAADCLVLPSDYGETWGLVVNEAMACGVPAIVSDRVGCGPDLVEAGVTGLVFPFGDVEALAACMGNAARKPEMLRTWGDNARRRVAGQYTVERTVQATVDAARAASPGK